jgi:hypothetical protein
MEVGNKSQPNLALIWPAGLASLADLPARCQVSCQRQPT